MDSALITTQQTEAVAHTPAYKRLTDVDRVLISKLAANGVPQVEIAQRIGCDQSSVSRWLAACQDSTKEATAYLKGSALKMARKVAASDDPKALIQALKGVSVLQDQQDKGFTVLVGNGGVVNFGQALSPPDVVVESERLQNP